VSKAAVLFTGGKDSTLALHKAVEEGLDVSVLVSIIPHYDYSPLYHRPFFEVLKCQAQALELPLESVGVCSESAERSALRWVLERVRDKYGVRVLVVGAIKSGYQLKAFGEVARSAGLSVYAPLWGVPEESYLDALIDQGLSFMLISVTSMGIPLDLLGRVVTREDVARLKKLAAKYGFNLSFEGGEAETLVVDAPLFKYAVSVKGYRVVLSEFEGRYVISKCSLVKK
jgi:ABC transporter with metal-binding/Fe-S-binding domain ATP-binding protein